MVKKSVLPLRELVDIPDSELKNAVIDFCNRLHIHGKGESYDLYEAIRKEKGKAKEHAINELLKNAG